MKVWWAEVPFKICEVHDAQAYTVRVPDTRMVDECYEAAMRRIVLFPDSEPTGECRMVLLQLMDFEDHISQRMLLAGALGDLLVATSLIREVPLTGPELLAFAAQLTEDLKEKRVQLVPADVRMVSEATIEELIAELRTRGAEGVVRIEYIGPPREPFYVETEPPKDPWDYDP